VTHVLTINRFLKPFDSAVLATLESAMLVKIDRANFMMHIMQKKLV